MSRIDNESSNTIKLAFLKTDNGQQMVIQEKELLVYAKTKHIVNIFAVLRGDENKPKWELEFQIKGTKEMALLVTSLNKPRQFPRLNNMVELIKTWCPYIENISIELHHKN